jgi:hypothetical protein
VALGNRAVREDETAAGDEESALSFDLENEEPDEDDSRSREGEDE